MRELGAGLQISANGTRVLIALGLRDAIEPIACIPEGKQVLAVTTPVRRGSFLILAKRPLHVTGRPIGWCIEAIFTPFLLTQCARPNRGRFSLDRKLVGIRTISNRSIARLRQRPHRRRRDTNRRGRRSLPCPAETLWGSTRGIPGRSGMAGPRPHGTATASASISRGCQLGRTWWPCHYLSCTCWRNSQFCCSHRAR